MNRDRLSKDAGIRLGRFRMSRNLAFRVASLVGVFVFWEIVGHSYPQFMSYPTAILSAAWDLIVVDRSLLVAFGETLWGLFVGYVIASVLGITIGFVMGRVRSVDIMLLPYVNSLYAAPRIALIPLLVLWVGIAFKLRVTIVILSAIFPIIITVRDGSRTVAAEYLDVARSFVATGWQTWRTAILPGSLPYVFVSLRIGAQRSLIGIIVAEMTASIAGTGRLIMNYGQFFETAKLLVPVVIIGFFSIGLTAGINKLQLKVSPWRRSEINRSRNG